MQQRGIAVRQEPFYRECRGILSQLMAMENSFYFFKPVDPEMDGASDYFSYIVKPMSFFVIQEKLDKQEYKIPEEFITDVRQIWQNAKLYNGPTHVIYKTADILAHRFEILIGSLPHIISDAERSSDLQRLVELRFSRYRSRKTTHQ